MPLTTYTPSEIEQFIVLTGNVYYQKGRLTQAELDNASKKTLFNIAKNSLEAIKAHKENIPEEIQNSGEYKSVNIDSLELRCKHLIENN